MIPLRPHKRFLWFSLGLYSLLVFGFISGAAFSEQPVNSLTLDQALSMALERNPQLQAAQSQLLLRDADIVTANARLNPYLLTDNGVAEKTYRLGMEQTFELGGKRKHRVALAQAQKDVTIAEIGYQVQQLRFAVRTAYSQLYLLNEKQKSYQNILDVTHELSAIAAKREQAGAISQLSVMQAEIATINANNELQWIASERVNAQSRLNALLSQPLDTPLQLAEPSAQLVWPQSLSPSSPAQTQAPLSPSAPATALSQNNAQNDMLNTLTQAAYQRRAELKTNFQNQALTRQELALAHANRIPNLSVTAGPDLVVGSGGGVSAFVIGSAEIPVFNRQQGPIRQALARQRQLEKEQAALKNTIAVEIATAYNSYRSNQARIERYQTQLLPYAIAVTEKSRLAFQEGKVSVLFALDAQRAYTNTRLGYLQALQDYQNAINDLEKAVGFSL